MDACCRSAAPSTAGNANETDSVEGISHPTRVAMEQGDVDGLGSSSASGSLPEEGSPPASPFNTTRGKRRKKKKSGRARAPEQQQQQEPFCLD
eukprot:COSAG06_NODE_22786_length_712_cov_1.641109_1_plen_92_part_01